MPFTDRVSRTVLYIRKLVFGASKRRRWGMWGGGGVELDSAIFYLRRYNVGDGFTQRKRIAEQLINDT